MTYVIRLNDRLWLRHADLDGETEKILATTDPEEAARFPTAIAAAREVFRVPNVRPLDKDNDYQLRRPLYDGGARAQNLDDARAEAREEEIAPDG